jgi:hypothetical protein
MNHILSRVAGGVRKIHMMGELIVNSKLSQMQGLRIQIGSITSKKSEFTSHDAGKG